MMMPIHELLTLPLGNESSYYPKKSVIGEDIDLLVLLIVLTLRENNMYFIKPSSGKIEEKNV